MKLRAADYLAGSRDRVLHNWIWLIVLAQLLNDASAAFVCGREPTRYKN